MIKAKQKGSLFVKSSASEQPRVDRVTIIFFIHVETKLEPSILPSFHLTFQIILTNHFTSCKLQLLYYKQNKSLQLKDNKIFNKKKLYL